MRANTILASAILALGAFGHAEPIVFERQFDITSAVDSYSTIGHSYYTQATAASASWYSVGLSAASVGAQEGLSDASTWLESHAAGATSVGAVFATVTTIGGVAESIVTSVGGPAITLAPNGAGTATSFAGSLYTVIASPTSTKNAAVNVHSMTLKASPVLTALVTVVAGSLLGAWLTC